MLPEVGKVDPGICPVPAAISLHVLGHGEGLREVSPRVAERPAAPKVEGGEPSCCLFECAEPRSSSPGPATLALRPCCPSLHILVGSPPKADPLPPLGRRRPATGAIPTHPTSCRKTDLELFMVRPAAVSASTIPARRADDLASRLPDLRAALEGQRDFRREQMTQIDLHRPTRTLSATNDAADRAQVPTLALREVETLVAAGARRALIDIELALARMRTGHYGCCRRCGTAIPLAVLEAIPKTTLCLPANNRPNTALFRHTPPSGAPRRCGAAQRRPLTARTSPVETVPHAGHYQLSPRPADTSCDAKSCRTERFLSPDDGRRVTVVAGRGSAG